MHFAESIFYARHGKELVFCTIDEELRFRTGEGGDVRFVDKKSIFLFIRLVIVCKIKKLSAKEPNNLDIFAYLCLKHL